MRQKAASAAVWTLAAFAVQLVAGVCADAVGKPVGVALLLVCWLMNGYAAYRLRCPAALGAAAVGAVLAAVQLAGIDPGWAGSIAVNLLFLLFYLPLQRGFDEKLYAAHVPERAHRLGRTWAMATLIQRGASMMGFLPFFQAQAVLSAQQGSFTPLFAVQLVLEIIALIAAVVSYIWMVRYLWRARRLLAEEGKA